MVQVQAVNTLGIMPRVAVFVLILRDHLLAAAGITGQRSTGQRGVLRDDAARDERIYGGDKAARVAAGVRDALGIPDRFAVRLGQLSKAVIPVRVGAVRGRGINDTGGIILDERNGLACRRIRQAQERNVGCVQELAALLSVLALVLIDEQQLDVVAAAEALVNLEAGRALFAVDVNFRLHRPQPPR